MGTGSSTTSGSVATWARALGNIAPLERSSETTLAGLLDGLADRFGPMAALESEDEVVTYEALRQRRDQYAHWAHAQQIEPGEAVCLLMPNCPDYVAIWLGITLAGGVAALLNTNLTGPALRHAIDAAGARHVIVAPALAPALASVGELAARVVVWMHGPGPAGPWQVLDRMRYATGARDVVAGRAVQARQTALLIFTSGTTGLPKAARVSHYRVLEWSYWFAGMMNTGPADRLYDCLPMYHSTGGVVGIGAMLVKGGTVVMRRRFSARRFWADIAEQRCTIFLYIGELCRYLVNAPVDARETRHSLRLCCGNGLRGDIWEVFQARFGVPHILEFYASTEGNVALYNCEGRPGAIGRVPSFLSHRFPVALIECDAETGEPRRGPDGCCIRCAPDAVGEAIGRIIAADDAGPRGFEGYTDTAATQRKVMRDVFAAGDAWFRTGDLMRRDRAGFYYFVDRIGDTFRWKGENVSTTQVAEVVCACPGVTGAVVYGVTVPGAEGRAGMAAVTVGPDFSLHRLRDTLAAKLPTYARPLFVRMCATLETTGTFKPIKATLVREGYDPALAGDALYVDDAATGSFVAIDAARYELICSGRMRL